jgi:hypothetical protein
MFICFCVEFANFEWHNINEALSMSRRSVKAQEESIEFYNILSLKGVHRIKRLPISFLLVPKDKCLFHVLIQIAQSTAMTFSD